MGLPGCLFVCHLILLLMCFLFNLNNTIKYKNAAMIHFVHIDLYRIR